MRYVKIITILSLIFIGSVVSAQANSGFVPTYEQTAAHMYETYRESIAQDLSDFESESNKMPEEALTDIEAAIAGEFGTSRDHVKKMIADYKEDYLNEIQIETDQLKSGMLEAYETEKKDHIEEEITDNVASFLDELLTE